MNLMLKDFHYSEEEAFKIIIKYSQVIKEQIQKKNSKIKDIDFSHVPTLAHLFCENPFDANNAMYSKIRLFWNTLSELGCTRKGIRYNLSYRGSLYLLFSFDYFKEDIDISKIEEEEEVPLRTTYYLENHPDKVMDTTTTNLSTLETKSDENNVTIFIPLSNLYVLRDKLENEILEKNDKLKIVYDTINKYSELVELQDKINSILKS